MSVTSGFFDSLNGDRCYNSEQMSSIFDGIINDGIFANIGTAFSVKADAGNAITVGIGRAWFNSTWINNDSILPITADVSEVLLDRYDAIIIEIDRSISVRAGNIKIIKGTPSSSPKVPEMKHTIEINQYPLAFVYRKAGSETITQSDITNVIGSSSCPYITGILETIDTDNLIAQWDHQIQTWFKNLKSVLDENAAINIVERIIKLENRVQIYVQADEPIGVKKGDIWIA